MDRFGGRAIILTLGLLLLLSTALPARAQTPTSRVTVSIDPNGAVEGLVLLAEPTRILIALKNKHHFWTNVIVVGGDRPDLVAADPRGGPGQIAGIYARWGVLPPNDQAIWEWRLDPTKRSWVTFQVTNNYLHGGPNAYALNVLSILAELLGTKLVAPEYRNLAEAVVLLTKCKDWPAIVQAAETGDLTGLVDAFQALLNDEAQRELITQALGKFGVYMSSKELTRLLTIAKIADMAQLAGDMLLAIVLGSHSGQLSFTALPIMTPTPLPTTMATATTTPTPPPIATLTPTPAPVGFSDPFIYCQTVETVDKPDGRWTGPTVPDQISKRMAGVANIETLRWRCLGGNVLWCWETAARSCGRADASLEPTPRMVEYCHSSPNASIIPRSETGQAAIHQWACRGTQPVVVKRGPTDSRGFNPSNWEELKSPPR